MATPARRRQWIIGGALARGLDPYAVLAVASTEGGFQGSIGDAGTSFGPFQLHWGGAMPRRFWGNKDASQKFANSQKGIHYALDQMAKVGAAGLKGDAAIDVIVRKFERPKKPGAQVAKAISRYPQFLEQDIMPGPKGDLRPTQNQHVMKLVHDAPAFQRALVADLLGQAQDLAQGRMPGSKLIETVRSKSKFVKPEPIELVSQGTGKSTSFMPGRGTFGGRSPVDMAVGSYNGGASDHKKRAIGNWQSDNAVDWNMPMGTPIYAVEDGVIGPNIGALSSTDPKMQGLRATLIGGGNEFYYAHMAKLNVKAGQRVKKGDIIGWSGTAAGVPHLHWGVRYGDPDDWFPRGS